MFSLIMVLNQPTALVRDSFGFQAGWSCEAASYTLAGVGGLPVNYPNGRLWNVALLDKQGKTYQFKGFGVPKIIEEPLGSGPKLHLQSNFPGIPKEVFEAKEEKDLDPLIGNTAFSLQSKCVYGLDCKDCQNRICFYQSRLSEMVIGYTCK